MPAHELFHQRFDVRQIIAIGKGRKTVWTDDRVEFGLSFPLDGRMQCHCEEESGNVGHYLGCDVSLRDMAKVM
jgi:hypothetical protein